MVNQQTFISATSLHQRASTPRPRVRGWVSQTSRSNERWAMDVTHVPCGQDGWGHLAAVIDCHDREVIGYECALRSRAKEAERAVEAACLARFGTLRPVAVPALCSSSSSVAAFGRPVETIGCSRSSSRRIRRAEWGDRAVLSESQREVRLATHVPEVRRRAHPHSGLDAVVQRRAPASGVGLSEPGPIPGSPINPGSLISEEQYTSLVTRIANGEVWEISGGMRARESVAVDNLDAGEKASQTFNVIR